jgi:hypothetical protein
MNQHKGPHPMRESDRNLTKDTTLLELNKTLLPKLHGSKFFFSEIVRTINKINSIVGTYVSEKKDNKCGKSTKNVKNTNKNNKHSLSFRVFRKRLWGVSFQ